MDNNADMLLKGRGRCLSGEGCRQSKLTASAVAFIKLRTKSSRLLGEQFGVTAAAIRQIWVGRNWRHVVPESKVQS
jgi:hypothetical protein